MTLEQARKILTEGILPDGGLTDFDAEYVRWERGKHTATLDGDFTAAQLEAIVIWMRES